ncbi:AAA family ATPase [Rhizobium ruizarguesonis]|uniref:AAA family ATPase n=1 Tax=Rhizobium ruizarguesonis TaxID=2081791 RepID=UPI00163B28FB|nr:AAA family ATPase [Rhizobium ruizarguesonis]MBC2806979.1 AAA family ATPase [Rhizobium ruizarguesonis]
MNNTFLREVHLHDFRTFGDFKLQVAGGPGLTLLVGTNGLGKSSFFDGIEWGLTGRIRRFENYVGRLQESEYITRRDATPGTHRVSLTFSEGQPLTRGLLDEPGDDALQLLLKDPNWTEISDIGAYLGFTHFLGQASQQRFTSRDKNDQWQALKGPSGIDRLEAIRSALRGRSTMNAFKRRAEREDVAVELAARVLEEWQGHTGKLAELRARSAAAGAPSEAALDQRLAVIEGAVLPTDVPSRGVGERLSRVHSAIEAEEHKLAQERASSEGLRAVVVRFATSAALIDADSLRKTAADVAVATATAQLTEAMLAAKQADQTAGEQTELLARAKSDHDERIRERAAIAEFAALEAERQSTQALEMSLQADRDLCQQSVTGAQIDLDRAHEAHATLGRLDNKLATLEIWSSRAAALKAQEISALGRRDAADTATAAADRARSHLPELERAAADAQNAETAARERLADRQRDASELAELLAGLAAHIGHDDTNCPVCASRFDPGDLQIRAHNALAAQDVQLAEEVHSVDTFAGATAVAKQALTQAQAAISAAVAAETLAKTAEEAVAIERAAIAEALGAPADTDFAALINKRLTETGRARAVHLRDAGGTSTDVSTAQSRLDALSASLASLDDRVAAAIQRRTVYETTLKSIEESLSTLEQPWSVEASEAAVEVQGKILEAARTSLDDLTVKRALAANAETAARERLAAAEAERDRIVAAISDANATRSSALKAWQEAGMSEDPSSEAVDDRLTALNERSIALAQYLEETSALSRGYEAWLGQNELHELRSLMEKLGGAGAADNPVVREQQLQAALAAARTALQLTNDTREAVTAYGEQLKSEADRFSTKFLLPLNDLIDAFNRALLSTPGETVQFTAEHTVERTSLAMQLRYADPIENAQYRTSLPPQLVLSEGQMAANGFSILCAASTAYRWSRWRALLLDDPLQHNDIIHAAAFVDVMRNLVEIEGYQLLMSSHKRDEGEFIARKFDAAGLPCTIVELIGASKDGVRIEPPRHNAAARRLLAEPEAKLA